MIHDFINSLIFSKTDNSSTLYLKVVTIATLMLTGRIAAALGFRDLSARSVCLIQFCIMYAAFYLMRSVFSALFGLIF